MDKAQRAAATNLDPLLAVITVLPIVLAFILETPLADYVNADARSRALASDVESATMRRLESVCDEI